MSYFSVLIKSVLFIFLFLSLPVQALEVPSGAHVFAPFKSVEPVTDAIAASSQPIGLGDVANNGDTFSLKVNLTNFTNPVDLYLALFAPEFDSQNIYLVTEPLGLQPHSIGMVPWKSNVLSVNEALFGDIPIALLPQSRYSVILLAVPAATPVPKLVDNFYLWSSNFSTLDLIDLSNKAINQLGGGSEAATAILLALDSGNSLESIIRAILLNTLTDTGEIIERRSVLQTKSNQGRPKICERFDGITICTENVKLVYTKVTEGLNNGTLSKDELETLVTAITLLASNKGYSSVQIYDAINQMVEKGTINIDKYGNIWENCTNILCDNIDRIKVEKDALTSLEEMLAVLEDEDNQSPDYGLNDIIAKVCAPLGSSSDTNKNLFDFVTCSETKTDEEVPNFEYDFSRINLARFSVHNVILTYRNHTREPEIETVTTSLNFFGDMGAIEALENKFTHTLNYVSGHSNELLSENIIIRLNKEGNAITGITADYMITSDLAGEQEYINTHNKITLSGKIPLTYYGRHTASSQFAQFELKGTKVCDFLVSASVVSFTRPFGGDVTLYRDVQNIECDENSSIFIGFEER